MIRLSLNRQIALGTVIGVAVGLWLQTLPADDGSKQTLLTGAELISGVFIDLLKMILAPLVFTSITVGVANLRAQQDMHRIWLSTLVYFVATSLIAIGEGLFTANVFEPGSGLDSTLFQEAKQQGRREFHFSARIHQQRFARAVRQSGVGVGTRQHSGDRLLCIIPGHCFGCRW